MAKITQEKLDSFAGKSAVLTVKMEDRGTLYVPVIINQARSGWGRLDFLVTPEGGEGEVWASQKNVRVRKVEEVAGK